MRTRKDLIKRCKIKLESLKKQYSKTLNRPMDNQNQGGEIIDMAFREQHLQHSKYFRDRMRALLPEIQGALARINDGTYGFCQISGEEIEENRLLAVPWTRTSIKSLEQREAS